MIDTKCITRKFTIKGVNVTIKPIYSMGYFEGYTAAAGNTTQTYIYGDNEKNISVELIDGYTTTANYVEV